MLDYQLFDLSRPVITPTNLLFHTANTLLLFLVLQKMTASTNSSRAGPFAKRICRGFVRTASASRRVGRLGLGEKRRFEHFFWLLTMWFYIRYVKRPEVYFVFAGFFRPCPWPDGQADACNSAAGPDFD